MKPQMQVVWGTFFFFFLSFLKAEEMQLLSNFMANLVGKKKREKKRQKRQRAELPPCQPTLLLLLTPLPRSPRWCGGLSSPPAALSLPVPMLSTVPKHPPCPRWVQRHRAPQHPAQQGPVHQGVLCSATPQPLFVAPFFPAHGFELAECLLPLRAGTKCSAEGRGLVFWLTPHPSGPQPLMLTKGRIRLRGCGWDLKHKKQRESSRGGASGAWGGTKPKAQ